MQKPIIVGIGEVLWDVFGDRETLGGAPINFAYYASALGAEGLAVSAVGNDKRGKLALAELKTLGVSTEFVTVLPDKKTGYVQVLVDEQGVASYLFPDDVAWDNIALDSQAKQLAARADAICFGSLAQRSTVSRQSISEFIDLTSTDTLKVFDLNLRQQFYSKEIIEQSFGITDVLKLNDEELVVVSQLFSLEGDMVEQLRALVGLYGLQLVVLTRGEKGSILVTASEISQHPGYKANIVDTIGAGDSFTATTIIGFLAGNSLDQINENANQVASYVCSQQGAVTVLPENILGVQA